MKNKTTTARLMLTSLAIAIFMNLPFYSYALEKDWSWASGFLFLWMIRALGEFLIFFHEIGHSLTGWFYGVPTIPMFDFAHGGGWAWMVMGQNIFLLFCVWGGLAYLWYRASGFGWMRHILIGVLIFNVATAFSNWHLAVFDFMGPAFEGLCGAFFLIRAFYNLTPRGKSERYLNAILGFAFPLHSLIEGYSLLKIPAMREQYYQQKDSQGSGDFDQIADKLDFASFNGAVILWMTLAALCLILPVIFYLLFPPYEEIEEDKI